MTFWQLVLVVSHFGIESGTLVLIAPAPGHCLSFTVPASGNQIRIPFSAGQFWNYTDSWVWLEPILNVNVLICQLFYLHKPHLTIEITLFRFHQVEVFRLVMCSRIPDCF